jgi:penicillin-binding protein 2
MAKRIEEDEHLAPELPRYPAHGQGRARAVATRRSSMASTGFEQVEVDASGRAVRSLARTPPVPGNNLQLTLDVEAAAKSPKRPSATGKGSLVAIEPRLGRGACAGVDPTLRPQPVRGRHHHRTTGTCSTSTPDRPMINRTLNGAYPPGSTFKPFMALGALVTGKRTPGQQAISRPRLLCLRQQYLPRRQEGRPRCRGHVSNPSSISCDTYYYILANDMGIDN